MRGRVAVIAFAGVLGAAALGGLWWLASPDAPEAPAASETARPAEAPEAAPAPKPTRPAFVPTPIPPPVTPPPPGTPPATATLRIEADVPGATVFVDRRFLGEAPVTVRDLTPGTHHINVSAEGHEGYSEDVEVAIGARTLSVSLKSVRLDARVEVTHKHAFGSCSGILIATPEGLRYETDNKDDAFSVRLENLEVWEMDYVGNTLKAKIKGGKTYNFAGKAADAEPLSVFRRDVEKVRQRLTGGGL